jgi:hypothetical protein
MKKSHLKMDGIDRAADCDIDHYLVVAKVRERLAVNKQRSHRVHIERLNFKKIKRGRG